MLRVAERSFYFLVGAWTLFPFEGTWRSFVLYILKEIMVWDGCNGFSLWFQSRLDFLFVRNDQSLISHNIPHPITLTQSSSLTSISLSFQTQRTIKLMQHDFKFGNGLLASIDAGKTSTISGLHITIRPNIPFLTLPIQTMSIFNLMWHFIARPPSNTNFFFWIASDIILIIKLDECIFSYFFLMRDKMSFLLFLP